MIKLQAEINDGRYDLNLRREGEQVSADVAGRTYSLEVHNPAAGVFLLRSGTMFTIVGSRLAASRNFSM